MEQSMLEKLIIYFIRKTKGYITKTQLVKFVYLADLYSVKWTEHQLTEIDWRYYHYGPWSKDIDQAISELSNQHILQVAENREAQLIQPLEECPEIGELELSKGLELMLRNIQKEWAGIQTEKREALLDFVYKTAPMLEVKGKHQPDEKFPLDLSLEHEKLVAELGV